jgi:hypothetical protein
LEPTLCALIVLRWQHPPRRFATHRGIFCGGILVAALGTSAAHLGEVRRPSWR